MTRSGSGGSRGGMSRGGGGSRSTSMARSSRGGYGGGYRGGYGGGYRGGYGGGYRGGRHYGGRGYSSFYFSPYGFGYGYYGGGWSIYLGGLGYGYYDYYAGPGYGYYSGYADASYQVADYVDTTPVETYVETESTSSPIIAAAGVAADYQLQAEEAFRAQDYENAVRFNNHAIVEDGGNGKLHLFASQALFAVGDYRAAAGALQRAASILQPSEWGYVVENYKLFYQGNDYVTQMESLVAYVKANPDASYAHLLRGYQYLFLGYKEAAEIELSMAFSLESRDRLAADLLAIAGGQTLDSGPGPTPSEEIAIPNALGPSIDAATPK